MCYTQHSCPIHNVLYFVLYTSQSTFCWLLAWEIYGAHLQTSLSPYVLVLDTVTCIGIRVYCFLIIRAFASFVDDLCFCFRKCQVWLPEHGFCRFGDCWNKLRKVEDCNNQSVLILPYLLFLFIKYKDVEDFDYFAIVLLIGFEEPERSKLFF